MVSENGGEAEIVVPPTIQALLQSRLDRLGLGRAGHDRPRCRRRAGLPPEHRAGARAAGRARRRRRPPPLARPQGADPPRPAHLSRRGGIPLPPPPRSATPPTTRSPRRPERSSTRPSPTGSTGTQRSSSRTRSWATTSSAPTATGPSSTAPILGWTSSRGGRRSASRGRRAAPRSAVIISAFCGLFQRAAELLPDGDPQRLESRFASAYPLVTAGRGNEAIVAARELGSSPDPRFQALGRLADGDGRRCTRGGSTRGARRSTSTPPAACSRPAGTMSAWHGRDSSRPTCAGCAGMPRWPQRLRSRPRRTPVPRGTTRSPHPCGAGR